MNAPYQFTKKITLNSSSFLQLLDGWAKQNWFARVEYFDENTQDWRGANLRLIDAKFPDVVTKQIAELRQQIPNCNIRIDAVDPSDHNFRSKSGLYLIDHETDITEWQAE